MKNKKHETNLHEGHAYTDSEKEAVRAFTQLLAERFSIHTPIDLRPPQPSPYGYARLTVSLSLEDGTEAPGATLPQAFFIQLYELLTRNIGAVPVGTTLNVSFKPQDHEIL